MDKKSDCNCKTLIQEYEDSKKKTLNAICLPPSKFNFVIPTAPDGGLTPKPKKVKDNVIKDIKPALI